jgi:hypothetical protein
MAEKKKVSSAKKKTSVKKKSKKTILKGTKKKTAEHLKKYQFRKGQSGNPDGRPVGSKNLSAILKCIINKHYIAKCIFEDKEECRQLGEWLCLRLVEKGFAGDINALKMIFERMEGKIPENINFNSLQQSEAMDGIKQNMRTFLDLDDDKPEKTKKK